MKKEDKTNKLEVEDFELLRAGINDSANLLAANSSAATAVANRDIAKKILKTEKQNAARIIAPDHMLKIR